jgi:hypothetical protein
LALRQHVACVLPSCQCLAPLASRNRATRGKEIAAPAGRYSAAGIAGKTHAVGVAVAANIRARLRLEQTIAVDPLAVRPAASVVKVGVDDVVRFTPARKRIGPSISDPFRVGATVNARVTSRFLIHDGIPAGVRWGRSGVHALEVVTAVGVCDHVSALVEVNTAARTCIATSRNQRVQRPRRTHSRRRISIAQVTRSGRNSLAAAGVARACPTIRILVTSLLWHVITLRAVISHDVRDVARLAHAFLCASIAVRQPHGSVHRGRRWRTRHAIQDIIC